MSADTAFLDQLGARLARSSTPSALAATVVRIGSSQAAELVARLAGGVDRAELFDRLHAGTVPADADPAWLLALARIAALSRGATDPGAALAAYDLVRDRHGIEAFDAASAELYAQLTLRDAPGRLTELLDVAELSEPVRWALTTDAVNPFLIEEPPAGDWGSRLTAPFADAGLEPVTVDDAAGTPFERLAATASAPATGSGTVTVVMSAYRPGPGILAAARSILGQSWRDLELLVVDDASPPEFAAVVDEVAALDERVRVLRTPANGGTYLARNLALDHARGEFVTFQDFDDWSHPRRLERQLEPLLTDPRLLATRSHTLRAFPDLTFSYPGYPPGRVNASSLLFRRDAALQLAGYFDAVRRSADVEYPERLTAAAPGSVLDLPPSLPLAVYQVRADSLSRGHVSPGWLHWTRTLYRDAYRERNRRIRDGSAPARYNGAPAARMLPLPDPSWSSLPEPPPEPAYDVVVLGDWRRGKRNPDAVIADLRAMTGAGLRVAVAQGETLEPPPRHGYHQAMDARVLDLVAAGEVSVSHATQPAATRLLLVQDPAALQFAPDVDGRGLAAERVAVLVDEVSLREEGRTHRAEDVAENAQRLFGRKPVWVPRSARVGTALESGGFGEIAAEPLIRPFEPAGLTVHVRRPGPGRPVVGRHVPDHASHWPAKRRDLLAAYPDGDEIDVRLHGGHRTPARVLGGSALPPNWVSYDDQVDVRTFLAQLDFFVYFDRDSAAVPGTAVLEAVASGCVVVLPRSLQPVYGAGAVYCAPAEVRDVVLRLHGSPGDFAEQQRRARRWADEHHGTGAFRAALRRLVAG
ncbi:glycosyltransferase [Jiangella endophytica]|uniref:glycosyltransferase n=1 Tax=Jiangella endophytica TaxID=1623398 RepID=UPI000E3416A1|nr:glycosyltransferase [Jiangella endophytica]